MGAPVIMVSKALPAWTQKHLLAKQMDMCSLIIDEEKEEHRQVRADDVTRVTLKPLTSATLSPRITTQLYYSTTLLLACSGGICTVTSLYCRIITTLLHCLHHGCSVCVQGVVVRTADVYVKNLFQQS